jgi:hypothetical protein
MPMQRVLLAVAMLVTLATGTQAQPATATSNLNLRGGPGPAFPVITMMPVGATVEIETCTDSWCRVKYSGQRGYANRDFLGTGESYASAAPPSQAPAAAPTLRGPRVWRWNDPEWRDRNWRRLNWHNRHKRP